MNFIFLFTMLAAILCTGSSTGLAGIGLAFAFTMLQKWEFKKWLKLMVPITFAFVSLSYIFLSKDLIFTSGRDLVWGSVWSFYRHYSVPLFGAGTGSFTSWGVAAQKGNPDIWVWLHNEFLEVLFENGLLGLCLVGIVIYFLLVRLWKKKTIEFPITIIYVFTALTEMPARLFVTQILGVYLLAKAFREDT